VVAARRGWLTGRYRRDEEPAGATRLGENPARGMEAYAPRNAQDRTWQVVDTVRDIAEGRGVSMTRVALAWVAAGLRLSEKETARLADASTPIVADYPYGEAGVRQRDRSI
jgi:aryl-alcohol dehydrogenase-like predicted oxidoreductase